jgi:hypothetical protein
MSILCGAAIVVILSVGSLVGTHQDHAVAVSHHDATPLTSDGLVHPRGPSPSNRIRI